MFVAEIGLNHKGNETKAFEYLKRLVSTEIDGITFQIPKQDFYDRVKEWGGPLSNDFYKKAIEFVHQNNKLIGFALGDKSIIPFLNRSGTDFWKLLSIYITDEELQNELQKTGKLIFVSTGVSDEKEIIEVSKKLTNIKLIHTQLSQRLEDTNLNVISRLKNVTNKEVAFGLHCSDLSVLYLSIAFDPSDIFFYVKENPLEKYPDDKHAILLGKVNKIVKNIRDLEKALGSGTKEKMDSQLQ